MKSPHQKKIRVFYDGTCGLCHYLIRFALPRIKVQNLYFSPLGGATFKATQQNIPSGGLPDSIVVYDEDHKSFLVKTEAVIQLLTLMNQPWKLIAHLLKYIPLSISNRIYDFVAKIRHRLFKKPKGSCPTISNQWKKFFQD